MSPRAKPLISPTCSRCVAQESLPKVAGRIRQTATRQHRNHAQHLLRRPSSCSLTHSNQCNAQDAVPEIILQLIAIGNGGVESKNCTWAPAWCFQARSALKSDEASCKACAAVS
jgi:hypothetical protein